MYDAVYGWNFGVSLATRQKNKTNRNGMTKA